MQVPPAKKYKLIKSLLVLFAIFGSLAFMIPNTDIKINNNFPPNTSKTFTGNDTVTKAFSVSGKGACKSSIENLVKNQSGVISANWDSVAQSITVTFSKKLVHKIQLCRILAQAGYDNAAVRAKDSDYSALPPACQYNRPAPSIQTTID